VTIRTRAAKTLTEEVWHVPMNAAELDRKFDGLVIPRCGAGKSMRLARFLKGLENAASVKPLMLELGGGLT
jgi:hypothetical protein